MLIILPLCVSLLPRAALYHDVLIPRPVAGVLRVVERHPGFPTRCKGQPRAIRISDLRGPLHIDGDCLQQWVDGGVVVKWCQGPQGLA
jgi:hypothetical protein